MAKKKQPAQRFRLLSDDDGHDYLVPVGREEEFYKAVYKAEPIEEFKSLGCSPTCLTFTDPRVDW